MKISVIRYYCYSRRAFTYYIFFHCDFRKAIIIRKIYQILINHTKSFISFHHIISFYLYRYRIW